MKKVIKKNIGKNNRVVIYQTKDGAIELRGDFKHENIWATQAQIAKLFNIERSVISKHISNIIKNGEVNRKRNVQKMHIAKQQRFDYCLF
jgi:hypothetical protein